MNVINVSVYNKVVEIEGTPVIICGNGDYRLDVTFDSEWPSGNKVARFLFKHEGTHKFIDVLFTGNTVAVPALANIREVLVGFYTDTLVTSTPGRILCEKSIKCADAVVKSNSAETDAIIEGTVTSINSGATSIKEYIFSRSRLTSASFPNALVMGSNAFEFCSSLVSVSAPQLLTIPSQAFRLCYSLELLNLPKVTGINDNAFYNCRALKVAYFPLVARINESAFYGCTQLSALIIGTDTSAVCTLGTDALSNTPVASGAGYIYVPDELVDSYKTAVNWSLYADQIKGISELSA